MSEYNDDDLNFDFDTTGVKTEKDLSIGSGPVPDGKYHVMVTAVEKDHAGNNPAMKLTFTVLAGTTPGQVNRQIHERIYMTDKAKQRMLLFASRLGLLSAAEFGQPNVRKNWGDARNKQVIVEVATREYEKKDGSKGKASNITFGGIWKLDDAEVKDVPRAAAARSASTAGKAAAADFDDL